MQLVFTKLLPREIVPFQGVYMIAFLSHDYFSYVNSLVF